LRVNDTGRATLFAKTTMAFDPNGLDRIGLAALAESNVVIEVIVDRLDSNGP